MTTLAPSTSGGSRLSSRLRAQVTVTEMSATESRRVMNTVCTPGRRVTCAIWPSTHTLPSRSIHDEIALAIWRTGAGWVGEVSRATAVSLRVAADSSRRTVSTSLDHGPHLDSAHDRSGCARRPQPR